VLKGRGVTGCGKTRKADPSPAEAGSWWQK